MGMHKILIVDDEQVERDGIQAILRKGFPEAVLEQARNGRMAIELVDTFAPDLILMDIKMAGMSGLEAVEHIRAKHPSIKMIMITAFDTFDFARQAIKLGVKDYLLKPSKAREIIATVGAVLSEIEQEHKQAEQQNYHQTLISRALPVIEMDIVTQLLFDHVHEVHLEELIVLLGTERSDERFVITLMFPSDAQRNDAAIREKIRASGRAWIGALNGRQLPVIVFRDKEKSFRSQAMELAREILSIPTLQPRSGWFIGIGSVVSATEQIRQSYQESLLATIDQTLPIKYRFYADVNGFTSKGRMVTEKSVERNYEKRIFDWVRSEDWSAVDRMLKDTIVLMEHEEVELFVIQQRVLELLWQVTRVLQEMGIEMEAPLFSFRAENIRQLQAEVEAVLVSVKKVFHSAKHAEQPDLILMIKQYIMDHAHESISLETIAKKVGFSSIYVSKIFKEQVGVNYIDFLTECRMEKAIRLMADPDKSMKEIAIEAGYHDPNYFSKVFRKMYQATPTEYRKTLPQIRKAD